VLGGRWGEWVRTEGPEEIIRKLYSHMQEQGMHPWIGIKSIIQQDFLRAVSECDFVENITLQGGGALHFVYGSPRISVNLDFVHQLSDISYIINEIKPKFIKYVRDSLNVTPDLYLSKAGEKFLRLKLDVKLGKIQFISSKVELYKVASYTGTWKPLIQIPTCEVFVESQLEILSDKFVAGLERIKRGFFKMRDIYDIWYLLKCSPPDRFLDKELNKNKLLDYNVSFKKSSIKEIIIELSKPEQIDILNASLKGYLPLKDLDKVEPEEMIGVVIDFFEKYGEGI